MVRRTGAIALAALTLLACDDGTGLDGDGRVEVRFEAAASGGASTASATAGTIALAGTNGTLEIERVHLIVGELELEAADGACPDDEGPGEDDDDCEEFEADPFLMELPLEGDIVTVAAADVRPGVYTAFEFEVEDVEVDEGDDEEELATVLADARALHADWPDEGSMVVVGTFTPADETGTRTFRTFIEAEIEVESTLSPPLEVGAFGDAAITVVLDPGAWFLLPDGRVVDLSLFDFTGEDDDLLELEVEFEEGIVRVEVEND